MEIGGEHFELARTGGGLFGAPVPAGTGVDYELVLDGRERGRIPCSRCQPHGLRGPSRVIDPAALVTGAPAAGAAWRSTTS